MGQATSINVTGLQPVGQLGSVPRPSEIKGECVHPEYPWIVIEWRLVYTTVGMDAAAVRIVVNSRRNGLKMDEVNANCANDRVWEYGAPSRIMCGVAWGRRILAMDIIRQIVDEIDASGWHGLKQRPRRGGR